MMQLRMLRLWLLLCALGLLLPEFLLGREFVYFILRFFITFITKLPDAIRNAVGCMILNYTTIGVQCGCGGYRISNIAEIAVADHNLEPWLWLWMWRRLVFKLEDGWLADRSLKLIQWGRLLKQWRVFS